MALIMKYVLILMAMVASAVAKDSYVEKCPSRPTYVVEPKVDLTIWEGNGYWEYMGCYQDDRARVMENGTLALSGWLDGARLPYTGPGYDHSGVNAPDNCARVCQMHKNGKEEEKDGKDWGYRFAAVQSANECYCPDGAPSKKLKVENELCNYPCPDQGKHHMACGGDRKRSVYKIVSGAERGRELWPGQHRQRGQGKNE